MANSFSASFPEIWAKEQQTVFHKLNVAMKIADVSFNSALSFGDTLNRPYRSTNFPEVYTPGTAITIDDKTDTNEALTVNKKYANGFYVDDFDAIQNNYDAAANYGRDNGQFLSNQVDSDVLGEATNATSDLDDGDFGGTTGNGVTVTASNISSIFGAARKKLQKQDIATDNLKAVLSPEVEEVMVQSRSGMDTQGGDRATDNGFIGKYYGFDLYSSNQLANSAVLSLATTPTDTDPVVINGVTFTFVTTIGTTAGNVLIVGSADVARANLVGLLNTPQTTDANGVALTGEDLKKIRNHVSAVNDNTADTATVTYKGIGALTVSEALTDATDTWTAAKRLQHNLFIAGSAPTLVMQSMPSVKVKDVPDKLGKNVLNGALYGVNTFTDNANRMVNLKVNASGF